MILDFYFFFRVADQIQIAIKFCVLFTQIIECEFYNKTIDFSKIIFNDKVLLQFINEYVNMLEKKIIKDEENILIKKIAFYFYIYDFIEVTLIEVDYLNEFYNLYKNLLEEEKYKINQNSISHCLI